MSERIKPVHRIFGEIQSVEFGDVFRNAARFCDLFVVPWLLDSATLAIYLLARLASLLIPFTLMLLGWRAQRQLAPLVHAEGKIHFRAAAARVNLGYMMICGAMGVMIVVVAPHLYSMVSSSDQALRSILLWLVIGQTAPVFFGATGLLMRVVDRGTFDDLVRGVTAVFYLVCVVLLGQTDAESLAQTLAAAQLAQAAICALLLTQCGIWPGLTALFNKEIKLF